MIFYVLIGLLVFICLFYLCVGNGYVILFYSGYFGLYFIIIICYGVKVLGLIVEDFIF